MRQEEAASSIEAVHDALVQSFQQRFVGDALWVGAETDRAERRGGLALEDGLLVNPLGEELAQPHVFVDARRQSFLPKIAHNHP